LGEGPLGNACDTIIGNSNARTFKKCKVAITSKNVIVTFHQARCFTSTLSWLFVFP